MSDQTNSIEKRMLMASAGGNLLIGAVGLWVAFVSESQAIMLDGWFNLTYFATGLFTLKVAGLVQRGDDEAFPYGYAFFEPLVNGTKGMLVLGVSVMALMGAIDALMSGGRSIAAGPAIAYGAFAATACLSLGALNRWGVSRSQSPLVEADALNWTVNGAISLAVLLAFVGIWAIQGTRWEFLAPYVDPSLVLIVVVITISVPVRMAWQALMELLNRAPGQETLQEVRQIIESAAAELPIRRLYVRVVQPGRTLLVTAHVVLPTDFQLNRLATFDALRAKALANLQQRHPATLLDLVFTADLSWGAPGIPATAGPQTKDEA